MYDSRIQYALDNFFLADYFEPMKSSYHLLEKKNDGGQTDLLVTITDTNLCISDFDEKKKCEFVRQDSKTGMRRSSDHLIFYQHEDEWFLSIIEMKTSVGEKTWRDIKLKTRTSYLTAVAIATFLGIEIKKVNVFTTYEEEKFIPIGSTTSLATFKVPLGQPAVDLKKEEWDKNIIKVTVDDQRDKLVFDHQAIQMVRNPSSNILEGTLEL